MVRDLKMSAAEFVDILSSQLADEHNLYNTTYTLDIAGAALGNYVPAGEAKDTFYHRIFEAIVGKIASASDASTAMQLQKYLFSYIRHAADVTRAVEWLVANETGVPNFTLSQGDRWGILKIYSIRNVEQAQALVAEETAKDRSDTGNLALLYCQNAVPTPENKADWWSRYTGPEGQKLSRYERTSAMSGFTQARQKELLTSYTEAYFSVVLQVISTTDQEFSYDFVANLFPSYAEESELIARVQQLLPQVLPQYSKIIRLLTEEVDLLEKYQRGKQLSAEYLARMEA
jgi:aminopeptidase N